MKLNSIKIMVTVIKIKAKSKGADSIDFQNSIQGARVDHQSKES